MRLFKTIEYSPRNFPMNLQKFSEPFLTHATEARFFSLSREKNRADALIKIPNSSPRDGLQKLIQQINHASCLAILYEDIQVGTQDAKCTKWLKLMGYPVYVSVASLRTRSPWVREVLYICNRDPFRG